MFFKYLIAQLMVLGTLPADGVDGWYIVDNGAQVQGVKEEEGEGEWSLFVKNLGEERIMASFPSEPTYRYLESGDLEISSSKNGDEYQITISTRGDGAVIGGEASYPYEGGWEHVRNELTDHHFIQFVVKNRTQENQDLHEFFSKFSIGKAR